MLAQGGRVNVEVWGPSLNDVVTFWDPFWDPFCRRHTVLVSVTETV